MTSLRPNEAFYHFVRPGTKRVKNVRILDIPGHGTFRQYIQQRMPEAGAAILLVDSSNRKTDAQASEFIYDILNSQANSRLPLLIACNKQDVLDARKSNQLAKDLESEMYLLAWYQEYSQQIKQSRKATIDEQTIIGPIDVFP